MATSEKISITVDSETLAWMRRRARRGRGNLSGLFTEAARLLRQHESRKAVLRHLGDAARTTPEQAAAIEAEWD